MDLLWNAKLQPDDNASWRERYWLFEDMGSRIDEMNKSDNMQETLGAMNNHGR